MTINLSSNSMNDILVQTKRLEANQLRKEQNASQQEKTIKRVKDTGWIDAINYAPNREWSDLFIKTPVYKTIDKSFIDKSSDDLKNSYTALKDAETPKQITNSIRNALMGISVPSLIAAATLIPTSHIAGMGYLTGWGINALVTGTATGVASGIFEGINQFIFNKPKKEALDNFVKELKNHAKTNLTDMHKYYNAADKLSKLSMSESDMLETLSNLYTEANKHLQSKHNVSLTDVYLSDDNKGKLKNYQPVEGDYTAHTLDKNMTSVPENLTIPDKLPDSVTDVDNIKNVVNLKIKALSDIGVPININELSGSATDINKKINQKYGGVLDNALLLYQGKQSMAAPIVDKVEKMLQLALTAYSKEVARQAKSNNLKDIPQLTSGLVSKIFSQIMLQIALPTNDPKLSKILKAMSDTTAFKVAANLNTYSSDSKHAKAQKELYGDAFLNDVYAIKTTEYNNTLKDFVATYNPAKSSLQQLEKLKDKSEWQKHEIFLKLEAEKLSKNNDGKKIWSTPSYWGMVQPELRTRRENGLGWTRLPYIGTKKYPTNDALLNDLSKHIK